MRSEAPGTTRALSDELIICTLNRPRELARCLASVATQRRLPSSVRIVDASADSRALDVVMSHRRGPLQKRLQYQREDPGLTYQRNKGVQAGNSDIVHFIDDDTELDENYIQALMAEFEADGAAHVVGVGGSVVNYEGHPVSLVKRLFLLDSSSGGRILRSGRTPPIGRVTRRVQVEWLSGCSMSYRRSVFESVRFDESLAGYGLGEDVEFSSRVGELGTLVVIPGAMLQHLEAETNRLAAARYTHDEIVNRARRVRSGIGQSAMLWFWWSVIGEIGALSIRGVIGSDRTARARLRAALRAAWSVAKDPGSTPT